MFILADRAGVFEMHRVFEYDENLEPCPAGVKRCRLAVAELNGRPVLEDVAPKHPLPADWHWATWEEATALCDCRPTWTGELARITDKALAVISS